MTMGGPGELASKGGFVLSLDFELMWGVRDRRSVADYGRSILGAREAIPRLLDLFDRHRIACTWATVGLLFFEHREALEAALPAQRPAYADPRLSPYGDLSGLGESEQDDPYHFGLSLIRMIRDAPDQEIGTHTFSHFYCLERGQTEGEFRADLAAARTAAGALDIRLESIVFPRNQVNPDYLDACREAGLIAYRGQESAAIYAAVSEAKQSMLRRGARLADAYLNLTGGNGSRPMADAGLVDVASSRYLRPWSAGLARLEPLRLRRILRAMGGAAARGEIFHLWFHPHNFGRNQAQNLSVLDRILHEAVRLSERYDWPSISMAQAARRVLAA